GTAYEVVLDLPPSSTARPARGMAILSGGAPSATLNFNVEEGTAPPTKAPPTLPRCDPRDCDGNVCTVGDTCAGDLCQPGPLLTAGQLSRFVRDDTNGARDECGGNRRSAVEKIARPLTQASHLLVQAAPPYGRRSCTRSSPRRVARFFGPRSSWR